MEEIVLEAFKEFYRVIKQCWQDEAITLKHVVYFQRLQHFSQCPYFRNCDVKFCLIDSPWSMEICIALKKLEGAGLIMFEEED